jgi:hypothetical protein
MKTPIRILLQNLAVLGLFILALLAYGWWRSNPDWRDRDLPVHYSEAPARGGLAEAVESGGGWGSSRFPPGCWSRGRASPG